MVPPYLNDIQSVHFFPQLCFQSLTFLTVRLATFVHPDLFHFDAFVLLPFFH